MVIAVPKGLSPDFMSIDVFCFLNFRRIVAIIENVYPFRFNVDPLKSVSIQSCK